jgi:hypothetical protein
LYEAIFLAIEDESGIFQTLLPPTKKLKAFEEKMLVFQNETFHQDLLQLAIHI